MNSPLSKFTLDSIDIEFTKCKGTWIYKFLALAVLACAGLSYLTIYSLGDKLITSATNAWTFICIQSFSGLFSLIFPIVISITIFMIYGIEHQANSWKHLFALPLQRWSAFVAKTVFSFMLIGLGILLFTLIIFAMSYLLDYKKPDWGINNYAYAFFQLLLPTALKSWIATFGFFTIQNWLSYRFKSFTLPVFVGIMGSIAGTFSPSTWAEVVHLPYSYPILTIQATSNLESNSMLSKSIVVGLIVLLISILHAQKFYKEKMI